MCNFRRKKILELLQDAQAGKITFEERDHLLQPYEQYIERVLDDCHEMDDEMQPPESEDGAHRKMGAGLDMKRICEEIREN